jgi:YHS domain-containing protein
MTKDPVCGMNVDPEKIPFTFGYQNQQYFFAVRNAWKTLNSILISIYLLKGKSSP